MCEFAKLINTFADDLKYGRKCAKKKKWELFLFMMYLDILYCHDIDGLNNCYTEDELKELFENISNFTKLCFQPYGFSYKS